MRLGWFRVGGFGLTITTMSIGLACIAAFPATGFPATAPLPAVGSVLGESGAVADAPATRGLSYRPVGGSIPVVEPGNGTRLPPGTRNPYVTTGVGEFEARCVFSHRAAHDPIVAPGQGVFRHLHDFFGNTTTDHLSTTPSLAGQPSSCSPSIDASAYWVPTLTAGGTPVAPTSAQVYYQIRRPQDPAKVRTMPHGLRIIAGDAMAMRSQPDYVIQWRCIGIEVVSATVPECGGADLQLLIEFPECWDGSSLDWADHTSHMAYERGFDCPATHPVLVPQVSFRLLYPVSGVGVALSSDSMADHQMPGGTTAHGDWINLWPQAEFDRRVATCLATPRVCDVDGNVVH